MKVTVDTSLEDLFNAFIADEMWAALNYKNAAFVSKGKALKFSNGIFEDNSDEEFEHMEELVDMAQSLGLKVKVNPKEAETNCTTPYVDLSSDEDTKKLVSIFLKSERAAIKGYQTALKNENVLEKPELCQFFGEICNDEHNHLKELMDLASNVGVSTVEEPSDDEEGEETEDETDEFAIEVDANDEKEDEKDEDSDSDTEKSILKIGSPLTGGISGGTDDDEEDSDDEDKEDDSEKKTKKQKKSDKDEDSDDENDGSEDDDEEDDEDEDDSEDEEDDDEEEDDEDTNESINESSSKFENKTISVGSMMKRAFSGKSKKKASKKCAKCCK